MGQSRNKNEMRLRDLITAAQQRNIEVRAEKLLREVGYRVRSGRCRVKGRDLILIDRDAPLNDQIEFLAAALEADRISLSESA
jgi:hypothetical protein